MKRNSSVILAASITLAMFVATPQLANAADLLSVYRDAINYDAQFAAARASVEAGREKLPQGRAGLMPSIIAGASTTWNENDVSLRSAVPTVSNAYNTHGWSVSLTQPLFRWQNWVGYNQAELAVELAETQFAIAKQDLILRVATAYFDALLAEDVLATAQTQRVAISETLESAKRNFEVGTATITDSHEAQARYDLATAQLLAAQNDLAVKRFALQQLVGKDVPSLKRLGSGVALSRPQPESIDKWVEMSQTGALGVQVFAANLEIANREIERQRSGHLPTLDLVASVSKSGQGRTSTVPTGVDTSANTVGLQLSLPLFVGGAVSSRDREAVALKEKAVADLDNARRSAAQGARSAFLGVTSGLGQVKAFEAALVSSQSALDSNKLGYEVGVRINIDVLNAQSQLYDTRQKLAKARLDTLLALLRLKAATGGLAEPDLASVNALLE
jgi:outer membrane protein